MTIAPSPIARIAGARFVRSLVNHGFHQFARRRVERLAWLDPVATQETQLRRLVRTARSTRFGRDHRFDKIQTVADYQDAVPLRTYEDIWNEYFRDQYPVLRDLAWPGLIPYFALTSGTTQGATKYIPVSRQMIASNQVGAKTMIAYQLASHPGSRLFGGRMFFLGGSTNLESPAPGVRQGDLSAIAAVEISECLRPYTFPPIELALETDWERKLDRLAEQSRAAPITLVGGVPSWLLMLFRRLLDLSGKTTLAEVWPDLEVVVHGGIKFDPYRSTFERLLGSPAIRLQETYPCSEGFIAFGDPQTQTGLLRLVVDHGLFYEFVPVDELESPRPTRHWLGNAQAGVNYAIVLTTCAGLWSHVVGDTICFESLNPPLLRFTGRTKYTLSAFGEHLISEEVEASMAVAAEATGAAVREWHVGPVFVGDLGYHQYLVEFLQAPVDTRIFLETFDADLRRRNADYQAHRADGVGMPRPSLVVVQPDGFAEWMRSKGKLGGQHKVPRMDPAGTLTSEMAGFLRDRGLVVEELPA